MNASDVLPRRASPPRILSQRIFLNLPQIILDFAIIPIISQIFPAFVRLFDHFVSLSGVLRGKFDPLDQLLQAGGEFDNTSPARPVWMSAGRT